jgi:hypothetical protein
VNLNVLEIQISAAPVQKKYLLINQVPATSNIRIQILKKKKKSWRELMKP